MNQPDEVVRPQASSVASKQAAVSHKCSQYKGFTLPVSMQDTFTYAGSSLHLEASQERGSLRKVALSVANSQSYIAQTSLFCASQSTRFLSLLLHSP